MRPKLLSNSSQNHSRSGGWNVTLKTRELGPAGEFVKSVIAPSFYAPSSFSGSLAIKSRIDVKKCFFTACDCSLYTAMIECTWKSCNHVPTQPTDCCNLLVCCGDPLLIGLNPTTLGAFVWSVFLHLKWILVAKSLKMSRSATEKRNLKKHLSLSAAASDQNHANRISRLKVGVCMLVYANVKVTAKRLDYYVGIKKRERLFGSNRWVKVKREQLWCDQNFLLKFSDCDHVVRVIAPDLSCSVSYCNPEKNLNYARDHHLAIIHLEKAWNSFIDCVH